MKATRKALSLFCPSALVLAVFARVLQSMRRAAGLDRPSASLGTMLGCAMAIGSMVAVPRQCSG
jgi:hypothetical protein